MSGSNGTPVDADAGLMSIVEAYESEIERLLAELGDVEAQRSQLAALLAQLVALFSLSGGYMTHGEQSLLRDARSLLAEVLR